MHRTCLGVARFLPDRGVPARSRGVRGVEAASASAAVRLRPERGVLARGVPPMCREVEGVEASPLFRPERGVLMCRGVAGCEGGGGVGERGSRLGCCPRIGEGEYLTGAFLFLRTVLRMVSALRASSNASKGAGGWMTQLRMQFQRGCRCSPLF